MFSTRILILASLSALLSSESPARARQDASDDTAKPKVELVAPVLLQGEERERFFTEVEKKMSAIKSVGATFSQEKRLALFKEPLISSGLILVSPPDQLRWEFRKPFRSVLIVSGDRVAKFEHEKDHWRKVKQGRQADAVLIVMDNVRSWFRGEFDPKGGKFEVDVARVPKPLIVMRPKDKMLSRTLSAVELTLAADFTHVVRVTIREKSGDKTEMNFTRLKTKDEQPMPTELFDLEKVVEAKLEELEDR